MPCLLPLLAASIPLPLQTTKAPHAKSADLAHTPHVVIADTGLAVERGNSAATLVFPTSSIDASGRWLLLAVSEQQMHVSLNGDGDRFDRVLHVVDLVTGASTNLGLAAAIVRVDDGRALVEVSEPSQGHTDLNGDGDAQDGVWFSVDLASATVRNTGLASGGAAALDGHWAALGVGESAQGQDLDGDGLQNDVVAFAWDLASANAPVNLGLAIAFPHAAVHGPFLLLSVAEGASDENGDGDTFDRVLHAYVTGSGATVNTGLALVSSTWVPPLLARGAHSAFVVSESSQGATDLNGDGDALDAVLHVFDGVALQDLALALDPPKVVLGKAGTFFPTGMRLSDTTAAFHVSEHDQGNQDLNSDGDAHDSVLYLHDFASATTRNLGVSAWETTLTDELLAFEAVESAQSEDWNGDGDTNDTVAQIHDVAAATTWNLGLRTDGLLSNQSQSSLSPFQVSGHRVAFPACEDATSGDLNGDGDTDDAVLQLADAASHQVANLGLATASADGFEGANLADDMHERKVRVRFHDAAGGVLSFLVSEAHQGALDRNDDGDALDLVLTFLKPGPNALLSSGVSAVAPLLPAFGASFPFLALESDDGIDRNGDGDALDTVVRIARVHF